MIGRYADHGPTCYTTLAKSPGAHFFETAEEIWRSMTPAARKAANMEFIQQVAAATWTVRSNLDLRTISSGALYDEIRELLRLGYTFSKDGKSMLPPKR
ncbi:MAG: hypothetical protein NTV05_16055 [Acidobacteria bacterium]|nr:hypothetical protein [Acidobacteriota bacterium]